MRSREFLVERIINLHTPEQRAPYANAVWDMLQRSYKKVGGFLSAGSPEELVQDPGYWKITKRGNDLTSVNIYKRSPRTKNYKLIALASATDHDPETDNYVATQQGLADTMMVNKSAAKTGRCWCEVSGPAERFLQRMGAKPIPNKFAELLTGKKILELNDDGIHYSRLIMGHSHEKAIFGFAHLSDQAMDLLVDNNIQVNELPGNVRKS